MNEHPPVTVSLLDADLWSSIWNAAIEAAAEKVAEDYGASGMAERILELRYDPPENASELQADDGKGS